MIVDAVARDVDEVAEQVAVDRLEVEEAGDEDQVEQQDQRRGRSSGNRSLALADPAEDRPRLVEPRSAPTGVRSTPAIACMIDALVDVALELGHLDPVAQHDDPVAGAQDLLELGRDEHARLAVLGQREDEPLDLGLGADVDAARGLVEDQDLRVRRQPAGEDDLLLVAAAQVADQLVGVRRRDLEQARCTGRRSRSCSAAARGSAASRGRPGPPGRCSRGPSGRRRCPRPCGPRGRARRRGRSTPAARTRLTGVPSIVIEPGVRLVDRRTAGRRSPSGPTRAGRRGRRTSPARSSRSNGSIEPARPSPSAASRVAPSPPRPPASLMRGHVVELGQLAPEHLRDQLEARELGDVAYVPTRRPLRRTVIRSATA